VPLADGSSCTDGDACNGEETCQGGVCAPGSAPSCADGNPCTLDTCSASAGCRHERVGYADATDAVETSLLLEPCVGARVPRAVHQLLARARVLLARARGASSPKKTVRLVRRATRKLTTALARAERAARRGLPPPCADPLRRLINEAIGRTQCLLPP
jgi:hypothetical protein